MMQLKRDNQHTRQDTTTDSFHCSSSSSTCTQRPTNGRFVGTTAILFASIASGQSRANQALDDDEDDGDPRVQQEDADGDGDDDSEDDGSEVDDDNNDEEGVVSRPPTNPRNSLQYRTNSIRAGRI
jgi:hypothetical protein